MKKGISRGKRCALLWICRIAVSLVAVCIMILLKGSFISVKSGNTMYQDLKSPLERNSVSFENSHLFTQILNDEVSNVTRLCVIRNQLETNGTYNGKKKIDINSFANRADVTFEETQKVEYYLDDLIKWGNYGFDFKKVSAASLGWGHDNLSIMVPRYLSVDGKELNEYADNIEEYENLVSNLQSTAESLFQNFTEYNKYVKQYGEGKTNIVYCFQFVNDGKTSYYTNLQQNMTQLVPDDITEIFTKYSKFIIYNPDKMLISTNTSFNASDMRTILSAYEYSFTDNSRVWIAVDSTYRNQDIFRMANTLYEEEVPYFLPVVVTAAVSMMVFLICLLLLMLHEGRERVDGSLTGKTLDRIPLELFLVLLAAVICIIMYGGNSCYYYFVNQGINGYLPIVLIGLCAFVCTSIILSLLLCAVRKCKSKTFFSNSLVVFLIKGIRSVFLETYDHGQIVSRTWLPYLLFLSMNLVLVLLGIWGIVLAFILDMLIGVYLYRENRERQKIIDGIEHIKGGDFVYKADTSKLHGDNLILANSVNSIGEAIKDAVETSMKDERLKADLITNVSHDIKTPLTSIINYVDLLKREKIENERVEGYIAVLEQKSQRLKQLTDDLVEASKISSGNIVLEMNRINFNELISQLYGEFAEKFEEKNLQVVANMPHGPVYILADSRRIYRVIENLYNNIFKYALQGTRVYIDLEENKLHEDSVTLSIKNISAQSLNIDAASLTERFIRGDVSRGTEGSGLGLSIAKNLTQAMNGEFEIILDGDLFKAMITFETEKE